MAEAGTSKQTIEKNVERGAAQMRETSDRLGASAEQTVKTIENSFELAANSIRDYNFMVFEFTQENLQATFDHMKQLLTAKSPSEALELWMNGCKKQIESFANQAKELTALGQKVATESAQPRRLH